MVTLHPQSAVNAGAWLPLSSTESTTVVHRTVEPTVQETLATSMSLTREPRQCAPGLNYSRGHLAAVPRHCPIGDCSAAKLIDYESNPGS